MYWTRAPPTNSMPAVFLANLLPGLRELRAPLAAGYAALLAVFVWAGGRLPSSDQPAGALSDLQDAADKLGAGPTLAILSFVAYLLGSLIADAATAFFKRVGRSITQRGRRSLTDLAVRECERAIAADPSYPGLAAVTASAVGLTTRGSREDPWDAPFVLRGLTALRETRWGWTQRLGERTAQLSRGVADDRLPGWLRWWKSWTVVTPSQLYPETKWATKWRTRERPAGELRGDVVDVLSRALADATYKELDMVGTRLIGDQSELYGAVDRLRSEAELRQAVTFPLEALALGLIYRGVWVAGVPLLVGAACLPAQGRRRIKAANDLLAESLLLERVKAPTLERFLQDNGLADRPPAGD
jgi:hypothetical protein